MEATAVVSVPVDPIQVTESPYANAYRVEVTPPGSPRPLVFRVAFSARGLDWTVRDPLGATLCRAKTSERGIEIARMMAERLIEQAETDAGEGRPDDDR